MRHLRELYLVLLGFILGIFVIVGCAANLEEESPSPKDVAPPRETAQVESEPEVKPEQNGSVDEDCDAIRSELEVIKAKYETLKSEHGELNIKFNTLTADFDELTAKYNNLLVGTPEINESDLEQAIFELINQDRKNNGLNVLEPATTFGRPAKEHSDYMAQKKHLELSEEYNYYWQDVFRATGYSTLDRIANAAMIIWKESLQYQRNFLNEATRYGVVAVSKSGEVFYITYFAHTQQ